MQLRVAARSPLFWALLVSLMGHALVLTLHFQPELKRFKDQLPTLEVMLVNSKTKRAPTRAEVLAQANLDRGGNRDEKHLMKSALPSVRAPIAPLPSSEAAARLSQQADELQREKARVAQLEQDALALLTQLKQTQKVNSLSTPPNLKTASRGQAQSPAAKPTPSPSPISEDTLQAIAKLEAVIAKQQEAYATRPKRQFIGARTQEYRFATYVEQWRQKVERLGNLNYPEAAKIQQLHGQLQLTVNIKADGQIESVRVQRSSGLPILDEAAKHIVQMAAPFEPFPTEIKKDTDVLSITRTWTFTEQAQLIAE